MSKINLRISIEEKRDEKQQLPRKQLTVPEICRLDEENEDWLIYERRMRKYGYCE